MRKWVKYFRIECNTVAEPQRFCSQDVSRICNEELNHGVNCSTNRLLGDLGSGSGSGSCK
ncbi:hypothetical protein DAI22_11g205400 [Oryza sativa Japonica Group]|nr:hypothetical protein DAI22_11g205400 [Oryza sativa Japonica Group]